MSRALGWTLWRLRDDGRGWDFIRRAVTGDTLKGYAREIRRFVPNTAFVICDPASQPWMESYPNGSGRMKWKWSVADTLDHGAGTQLREGGEQ